MRIISLKPRTLVVTVGVFALLGGCLDTSAPQITGPTATHYTVVEGQISSLSSESVPFAGVGVRFPTDRSPDSYYAPDVQANETGTYQLLIARTGDVGPLPPADTLTVWVVALQPPPTGAGRRDSAAIRLDFHPVTEPVEPQRLDITLAVP